MEEAASSTESKGNLDELLKHEDHGTVKTISEDDNVAFLVLLKTFEYLSIPDILNACQVSKLWNFVGSHDVLWRKVELRNCFINDYDGLFKKLLKHGTQELDIEDAILVIPDGMPKNEFWKKMFKWLDRITTLNKVKWGGCTINSVSKIFKARGAPQLKSVSVPQSSNLKINLSPLKNMFTLKDLKLKGANIPVILRDVSSLQNLTNLSSLSLRNVENFHELINFLPNGLRSLELGWFYKNQTSDQQNPISLIYLSNLVHLKNIFLYDESKMGIFLNNTDFLKPLNELESLKFDRVYCEDLFKNLPPGLKSLTFDWHFSQLDVRFLSKVMLLNMLKITDYRKQLFLLNVDSLFSLKYLKSLSLKGIKNLNALENFLPLSLELLELRDCDSLTNNFTTKTIPTLINLKKLGLENGSSIFQTTELLNVIKKMPRIIQLSLINMELRSGFEKPLSECIYLESLQISPYCRHNLDSLNIHQKIISSVTSLEKTLKSFNLGFNRSFLDMHKFLNKDVVKVLPWNGIGRQERKSIIFVNPTCPCVQQCVYPLHVIMIPIKVMEKEILPKALPNTRSWITKIGFIEISSAQLGHENVIYHSDKYFKFEISSR